MLPATPVLVIGRRVAETAGKEQDLCVAALPFPMPAFTARMFWHTSTSTYAPLLWFRKLIASSNADGH